MNLNGEITKEDYLKLPKRGDSAIEKPGLYRTHIINSNEIKVGDICIIHKITFIDNIPEDEIQIQINIELQTYKII